MTIAPPELESLPTPAQRIMAAGANPRMKQLAAKAVVPGLKPDTLVTLVALLTQDPDAAIAAEAQATLGNLPPPVLNGALGGDLHPYVVDLLAQNSIGKPAVMEKLLAMPSCPIDTVVFAAKHGDEQLTELVATNQERLLANPDIIAALYLNKATRMSTADRIVELATRNGVEVRGIPAWKEATIAIQNELIPEPSDEPLPDDVMFYETSELAEELTSELVEDAFLEDETGAETLDDRFKPLYQRLAEMTVSQKIRRAMLGSKEERMMLVREQNRVIATAAVRSPLMKEGEIAMIARNRNVAEDVLRIIGSTPEWLKSYQVKRNLVTNSKTPIAIATQLIPQLRESDLSKLASDKNVSSAIQMAARRHLQRRKH